MLYKVAKNIIYHVDEHDSIDVRKAILVVLSSRVPDKVDTKLARKLYPDYY